MEKTAEVNPVTDAEKLKELVLPEQILLDIDEEKGIAVNGGVVVDIINKSYTPWSKCGNCKQLLKTNSSQQDETPPRCMTRDCKTGNVTKVKRKCLQRFDCDKLYFFLRLRLDGVSAWRCLIFSEAEAL